MLYEVITPGARARGAFVGLIAGMAAVAAVSVGAPTVSFLWHNVVGAAPDVHEVRVPGQARELVRPQDALGGLRQRLV